MRKEVGQGYDYGHWEIVGLFPKSLSLFIRTDSKRDSDFSKSRPSTKTFLFGNKGNRRLRRRTLKDGKLIVYTSPTAFFRWLLTRN
ncbi:MAG: hypothetical protein ACLRSW_12535 [Christensenellaceae bacterium]